MRRISTHSSSRLRLPVAAVIASLVVASGCDEPSGRVQPQVLSVGLDHDRALAVLEREAPLPDVDLTLTEFEAVLDAAQGYYVNTRGFDKREVAAVASEILDQLDAAGLVQARDGGTYVELGDSPASLLRVIDLQARNGQISPRLAETLHRVWEESTRLQDESRILAYIGTEFGRVRWTAQEQPIADAFVEIARYSAAYWPTHDETAPTPRAMRPPRWVTILADALGGAVGGTAGAAAGGPIGAGIGAGLLGAAASHVFGR